MENRFHKIVPVHRLQSLFRNEMSILYGGFGGIGTPPTLVDYILSLDVNNLTLIGNDTGFPDIGIGKIVSAKRAKKLIVSHIGSNPNAGKQLHSGELDIEFSPQGILMERIRAGGSGIAAFLSDIGVKHETVSRSKQRVVLQNKEYLLETGLTADVAIVYAKVADEFGNVIYDKSARNSNPLVAMAGNVTIVEAEEIVPLGALQSEEIITPGVFVDFVIQSNGVNWTWAWEKA